MSGSNNEISLPECQIKCVHVEASRDWDKLASTSVAWTFTLGHNLETLRNRTFIFHMHMISRSNIIFSSTGRDQSSLCDTPLSVCPSVRLSVRPSVRLSVCPSVNNSCYCISSEAIYHRDFFIVPVCWPYGVVVHLRLQ